MKENIIELMDLVKEEVPRLLLAEYASAVSKLKIGAWEDTCVRKRVQSGITFKEIKKKVAIACLSVLCFA